MRRSSWGRTSALHIMKQQVTAAEYDRCVAEAKCMPRPRMEHSDPNLPAVQTSREDATAYAIWPSAKTGETWRLPPTRNGLSQRGRVSMMMLYRLPSRPFPCAGLPVTKRNRNKRHWISDRALPGPARMSMDCSISLRMSGNGRTPSLSGNRSRANPLALWLPIVACESSKADTAPL
jgi:Sulfatase-modifying factor enzyme 1